MMARDQKKSNQEAREDEVGRFRSVFFRKN